MRGDEFLDKMELVDPAYVEAADMEPQNEPQKQKYGQTEQAETKHGQTEHDGTEHDGAKHTWMKHAWMKWAAAAACLCLIAAAVLPYVLPQKNGNVQQNVEPLVSTEENPNASEKEPSKPDTQPSEPERDPFKPTGEPDTAFAANTSDTYATLPELLAYLSSHESHDSVYTGDGLDTPAASGEPDEAKETGLVENTGVAVSGDGKYSYHIGEDAIYISQLDGKNTQNVGTIDENADAIFACGNHLLVISRIWPSGNDPDFTSSVCVGIYDITAPDKPTRQEEYTQLGELSSCWMVNGVLFLVTSDGQCACEWSRTDDLSQYYPSLQHNDKAVEWTDEDISILGEPTKVQYSAITAIDGSSGQIVKKKAIYGDIWNLFYGEGWIAASVFGETLTYRENPVLYTFGSDLGFTGKINTAEIMGAPEKNTLEDGMGQDGSYLQIESVSNYEGIYRLLGTFLKCEGDSNEQSFMAIAANAQTGESGSQLLKIDTGSLHDEFTEILWEDNRAIACIGIGRLETKFLFAEFSGSDVTFQETELKADYLNSQVGMISGNPFGDFETLIPMGDGIYVRYSNPAIGPGGFDVFDFSDSAAPKLLYRAEDSLSGQDAFDFAWHVYDARTFGTLKVLLDGGEEYFQNVKLAWCIYSMDDGSQTEITLQEEHLLDGEIEGFSGAQNIGFAIFEANGNVYYVTEQKESAAVL